MRYALTVDGQSHYNGLMMHQNRQRGQVGLVVLLIASVLLTLGIGVASQSVLDTKTATQETDSSKIFNATERAIEEALKSLTPGPGNFSGVPVEVSPITNEYQADVAEGEVAQVDISDTGVFGLSWTNNSNCDATAAVVVTMISGANGETVNRYAYDKTGCSRGNGFTGVSCSGMTCSVSVGLPAGGKLARIKVLYADTQLTVGLDGNAIQSYEVTAQGSDQQSGETRRIQVDRGVAAVPSIFDYALFSGYGGISKQE